MRQNIIIFVISVIIILIDQLSKVFINTEFILNKSEVVIKDFFYLTNVHNEGIAFGLMDGGRYVIIALTLVILVLLFKEIKAYKYYNQVVIPFALIIGGLFGNLIDRILYGYVRDFLSFVIFNYKLPVFNISDICIVLGVIYIVIFFIVLGVRDGNRNKK